LAGAQSEFEERERERERERGRWDEGVRIRTSRDPGAPVADDGDLVDERDAAEHGGELRLGHLLRHLPHEQLHGLPAAPFRRLLLVLVAVDAVLRHCARVCGGGGVVWSPRWRTRRREAEMGEGLVGSKKMAIKLGERRRGGGGAEKDKL
jgi:hypothetical protein